MGNALGTVKALLQHAPHDAACPECRTAGVFRHARELKETDKLIRQRCAPRRAAGLRARAAPQQRVGLAHALSAGRAPLGGAGVRSLRGGYRSGPWSLVGHAAVPVAWLLVRGASGE
jgi:hypothetical protein